MSRSARRASAWAWGGALTVFIVVATLLSASHRETGYARDEGIYFAASRSYARWIDLAYRDPSRAFTAKSRDRHFSQNHEHPALMKIVGGVAARHLGSSPATKHAPASDGQMPEGAAMRLPAQLLAAFATALLWFAGVRRAGVSGGLLAAGAFILLPRVWFNAGLHAFDVPVTAMVLAVVLAYRRALRSAAWGVALGVLLGIAIAVKHNALFVGPLLALHYYGNLLYDRLRFSVRTPKSAWCPLPMVSMATLGPLVALALWPWLWTDPVGRFTEYMEFHSQHSWYNMELLGVNFNQPPMPWSYPWLLILATVPVAIWASGLIGAYWGAKAEFVDAPDTTAPAPSFWRPRDMPARDTWLWILFAVFPVVLISHPWTPIFGGTKHWITAYPFVALLLVEAWARVWPAANLPARRRQWMQPLALVLVLGPTALSVRNNPNLGLSQFSPAVGGPRGAATLGFGRGFWGHAVRPLLPALEGRKVFLHDVHELARRQYERERDWPKGAASVPLSQSEAGLLFHELHMTSDEVRLWNRFGPAPSQVLELDDVPLTSLYGTAAQ